MPRTPRQNIDCPECDKRIATAVPMIIGEGLQVAIQECPNCGYSELKE